MSRILFAVFLIVNVRAHAQAPLNLAPNGSFEEYLQCPHENIPLEEVVKYWYNPTENTPDYFNACNEDTIILSLSTPCNMFGCQTSHSGNCYGGFYAYSEPSDTNWLYQNIREYLGVRLIEFLQKDTAYCVEFYVSPAEFYARHCVTSSVGAYLSVDSVYDHAWPGADTLDYTPQIINDSSNFIADTLSWTKVSGTFVSQGGERYLTIGNFYPDVKTKLLHYDSVFCGPYLYIDDVWVYKGGCVAHPTSIANIPKSEGLNLYPNPTNGRIRLSYPQTVERPTLQILDVSGRVLEVRMLYQNPSDLDYTSLQNGVYTVRLTGINQSSLNLKFIIMK